MPTPSTSTTRTESLSTLTAKLESYLALAPTSATSGTVVPSKVDVYAAINFLKTLPYRVSLPDAKLTTKGGVLLTWGAPDCGEELEFGKGKVALFQAAGVGKCPTALLTVDIPQEALTSEWVEEELVFFKE